MLQRIALLAIAAPRRIVALAALVMVGATVFGLPVAGSLSAGGFQDPTSSSARATRLLTDTFGQADMQLVFTVTASDGAASPAARAAALDIVDYISAAPNIAGVQSAWTSPPPAAAELTSRDGRSGLIVAGITGGEKDMQTRAKSVADYVEDSLSPRHSGVSVLSGGSALVYSQINEQNERDLLLMESIALPLSFGVLVWVFGGLLAAALPMALGALAIMGSMSVLRLVTFSTDVSIFALNIVMAMGLALAIDYTLLIISRYRDELADGADRDEALVTTMMTAGRTVLFSATTVALSMAATVIFPMYFLTGSVVMPVKALVLTVLSLSATFGALVWIFQDGHLGALGTTPTGTIVANIPVLLRTADFGCADQRCPWSPPSIPEPLPYVPGPGRRDAIGMGVRHSASTVDRHLDLLARCGSTSG